MKKTQVLDLFCGIGGLTYGLRKAGLNVTDGFDIDRSCEYPFKANNRANFINCDLSDFSSVDILKSKMRSKKVIKIIAGCAPCQPFSSYTRKRKTDERAWGLIPVFANLVKNVEPDIVFMENVPQLAKHPVFGDVLNVLCKGKYFFAYDELECVNFGIPQTRKRLTLLASRLGPIKLPDPTHTTPVTVRSAIDVVGLCPLNSGERSENDPLHVACRLSPLNLQRIRASLPGGTWRDWPPELLAKCHAKVTGETYPSVYGRMEWEKPAPTITTQCFGYGNGRFGHPSQDRAITLREAALLQTFPIDYKFTDPSENVIFARIGKFIGNAVPPRLAEVVGKSIIKHIKEMF